MALESVAFDETLFCSELTRVYRRHPHGESAIVCKELLGARAGERHHHEMRMLERLAGVPGVPRLVHGPHPPLTIAMADDGAVSLDQALGEAPLAVEPLLKLAVQLAGILSAAHRAGVAHKNLTVDNILYATRKRFPLLVDFSLATTFAEERPGFLQHRDIAGTLPYLAPEQTGRTGRPVDLRVDLYGLGVVLYLLGTGRLPFAESDPLQLIHDILAKPPLPPEEVHPAFPRTLSRIILRLLEKDPELRYQSAEGVQHDLLRLQKALSSGEDCGFTLGQSDFPLRLAAPVHPVGRAAEMTLLRSAFVRAREGRSSTVLVSGDPGVGKTTLVHQLRPLTVASGGWFVSGKFDQYRRDLEADGVYQAMRALGRLLLAEPEAQLALMREGIRKRLGVNAGLSASIIPEVGLLLGDQSLPLQEEPLKTKERLVQGAVDLLRAVATPQRPLVFVLDDLQWASPTPLALVDLLTAESVPGLLLVGAFREGEVDAAHPLRSMLSRWGHCPSCGPLVALKNLSHPELGSLVQRMLGIGESGGLELAQVVAERTAGNPYDTVELVNALRRDGILATGPSGWSWDTASIRRYVGGGEVVDLLSLRIGRLPAPARELLETAACLAGELPLPLLQGATGLSRRVLKEDLAPALEDGLLVWESEGQGAVAFRHDRVQQAAYGRLTPERARLLHLSLARRLSLSPDFVTVAAEQYLTAADALEEPAECRRVIALFREAALRASGLNFAMCARYLEVARLLLQQVATPGDNALWVELECELHAALYSLGKLEEADEIYRSMCARHPAPEERAAAACLQVCSLTNRGLPAEAVAHGVELLAELGLSMPVQRDLEEELACGLELVRNWLDQASVAADLARPEVTDRRITAAASLINRMIPPAYFSAHPATPWLFLVSQRLWVQYGPCAQLVGPLSHAAFCTIALGADYRTGYRMVRHVLAVSEARGYEPQTSQSRFLLALSAAPWFEPLEDTVLLAQRSREGLLHGGDLQNACFTYYASIPALLDCCTSLEHLLAELDSCLAFAQRTANVHCTTHFAFHRELLLGLLGRGEWGGLVRRAADPPQELYGTGAVNLYSLAALEAALFGDSEQLVRHAEQAIQLSGYFEGCYCSALINLLQGLALAERVRTAQPQERPGLLERLDACAGWLKERAAGAPGNFRHLWHLVQAERAWALHDFRGALVAFDAALGQVEERQRPWHAAYIAERAALFHLDHGMEHSGRQLLSHGTELYRGWGAHGKVAALEERHPFLRGTRSRARQEGSSPGISSDAADFLAVLRASQALSSETSLERLRAQVVQLLGTMTGATSVSLVLRQEERGWVLLPSDQGRPEPLALAEAVELHQVPETVFRYLERTREPLLVEDAKRDDRFAFDPYLAALRCCALLALPILNHGELRAVLLLENRSSRGAFTAERLDLVQLMAGQLAVSLENALLYEKLEERVAQRTRELEEAQSELVSTARRAGMAEIATNVLHNVGNVLNSVNVSAELVAGTVRASKARGLTRAVGLMKEHAADLGSFFAESEKGKLLPDYLDKLARALEEEKSDVLAELARLTVSLDHIKHIVATQQSYAGASSMMETACACALVEDALRMNADALERHRVTVVKELGEVPLLYLDKARVLQILVNLISNAKYAMDTVAGERTLTVRTEVRQGRLRVQVCDRGVGIAAENLSRIFSHGFTTRSGGHGFGLHSCALAAKAMGGVLTAASDGVGTGAIFTLELPLVGTTETTLLQRGAGAKETGPADPAKEKR